MEDFDLEEVGEEEEENSVAGSEKSETLDDNLSEADSCSEDDENKEIKDFIFNILVAGVGDLQRPYLQDILKNNITAMITGRFFLRDVRLGMNLEGNLETLLEGMDTSTALRIKNQMRDKLTDLLLGDSLLGLVEKKKRLEKFYSEKKKLHITKKKSLERFRELPVDTQNPDELKRVARELLELFPEVPKDLQAIPKERMIRIGYHPVEHRISVLTIDLSEMNLGSIEPLKDFRWLCFLDLSKNKLKLESLSVLSNLTYLLHLKADLNLVESTEFPTMESLMILLMRANQIVKFGETSQPYLEALVLDFNFLKEIDIREDYFPILCRLSIQCNLLTSMTGIKCTNLRRLYLRNNFIKSTKGVGNLINLEVLDLQNNKIHVLEDFHIGLDKLRYINLRENDLQSLKEFKSLNGLSSMRDLDCFKNPFEDFEDELPPRIELLAYCRTLTTINGEEVTEEEQRQANEARIAMIKEAKHTRDWLKDYFVLKKRLKEKEEIQNSAMGGSIETHKRAEEKLIDTYSEIEVEYSMRSWGLENK